ncbi:MAG: NnrS family protein [Arenicellales bacterium]
MLINLEDPATKPDPTMPLLQLGFRPFFLLAGVSAALLILVWGILFSAGGPDAAYGAVYWHGHEMVFGYTSAVIAGFLLTAVKNWTGRQTINGVSLLLLSLLWVAARMLPFFPETIPYWLLAIIDLSFLPAVAAVILPLLVKTKNHRNLIFAGIVVLLSAANIIFHLGVAGVLVSGQTYGLYAGVYIILLLISIMGGRVIPFFIERGTGTDFTRKSYPAIETSASLMLLLLGILHTAGMTGMFTVIVAFLAAILHLFRLSGWYAKGVWQVPLLWVLVLSYGWIIVGLFLMALAIAGVFDLSLALHALTIGGIGLLTMGMMVRVSMGHSGRKLAAPGLLPAAFAALNLAVVVRVLLPLVLPAEYYPQLVLISALIWVLAFAVFVYRLAPVYFSARADGRPG